MGEVSEKDLTLVGIGSSAGGLEALQGFIRELVPGNGAAYVVAQHLDPRQPTLLVSLLSRVSHLPVLPVENGSEPQADHIYVIPPNYHAIILDGRFSLQFTGNEPGPKPSINTFFYSLAREYEEKAIGIILSGTGSDGSDGIRSIKSAGGVTLVQRPDSAKFSTMPLVAIQTGLVDAILPPGELALLIPEIIQSSGSVLDQDIGKDSLEKILGLLLRKTGVDFSDYKMNTVQRRIDRRMSLNRSVKVDDYIELLESDEREAVLLLKDLLIVVTYFFRDTDAFEELKRVLVKLTHATFDDDQIRIWVPACSTGEEVYSIAILMAEILGEEFQKNRIQIFATDVSEESIRFARKGRYLPQAMQTIPEDYRNKYFVKKEDSYEISQVVRDVIIFSRQDLVRDPPFLHIDFISCRNLMIYFNQNLQSRVLGIFHHSLNRGGYLFLGRSETVSSATQLYYPVDAKNRIFRKADVLDPPRVETLNYSPRQEKPIADSTLAFFDRSQKNSENLLQESIDKAVLEFYGSILVVVDPELNIVYNRGQARKYLDYPEGVITNNLMQILKEKLCLDTRAIVARCRRTGNPETTGKIPVQPNGKKKETLVSIQAIPLTGLDRTLTLLVFQEENLPSKRKGKNGKKGEDERFQDLEHELILTRERLHSTIQELETTNEALQSSNEELQSSIEELQSSNEELETSNEELQSTNEELTTVNDELQAKTMELHSMEDEFDHMLRAIRIGMVIVDRNLLVRRFSSFSTNLLQLSEDSIGTYLGYVEKNEKLRHLEEMVQSVISEEKDIFFRLELDDYEYEILIQPLHTYKKEIQGAVLSFHVPGSWVEKLPSNLVV